MENFKTIKFKKYKCFVEESVITPFKPVNLIIGKNNSGKSTFLTLIQDIFCNKNTSFEKAEIIFTKVIDKVAINLVFPHTASRIGGFYAYSKSQYDYGKVLEGEMFSARYFGEKKFEYIYSQDVVQKYKHDSTHYSTSDWNSLTSTLFKFNTKSYFKVAAERDIKTESLNGDIELNEHGDGLTSQIANYLRLENSDSSLIEKNLLEELNGLLKGEAVYTRINVLDDDKNNFNIYLYEKDGERRKLSDMGSGLKTLIFVLFVMLKHKRDNAILFFEELENNLHPEIQRRLFEYIYRFALENNKTIFITSHSSVSINTLSRLEQTKIYHVFKENNSSRIIECNCMSDNYDVLDDLGAKASDIFQSNGIIWVEGPSDRIYIKKWLNVIDPSLIENTHYTFLYYGGKLLSHYSLEDNQEFINILLTNKNSVLVMDSDKTSENDDISETKKRLIAEFESNKMMYWLTSGREIENYICCDVINDKYNSQLNQVERYGDFNSYIKPVDESFERHKIDFARGLIFAENNIDVLDLKKQINELANNIKKWNG